MSDVPSVANYVLEDLPASSLYPVLDGCILVLVSDSTISKTTVCHALRNGAGARGIYSRW